MRSRPATRKPALRLYDKREAQTLGEISPARYRADSCGGGRRGGTRRTGQAEVEEEKEEEERACKTRGEIKISHFASQVRRGRDPFPRKVSHGETLLFPVPFSFHTPLPSASPLKGKNTAL